MTGARRAWKVLLAVGGVFLLTSVLAGAASIGGLLLSYRAIESPSVDPSMKAQVLADGISHSMNATAFSLVTGLLAFTPSAACSGGSGRWPTAGRGTGRAEFSIRGRAGLGPLQMNS